MDECNNKKAPHLPISKQMRSFFSFFLQVDGSYQPGFKFNGAVIIIDLDLSFDSSCSIPAYDAIANWLLYSSAYLPPFAISSS